MTEKETVARKVIFHGRVQGVGFRWTTAQIAKDFEVVGSVRNLSDGTVELIVQATETEIRRFVEEVRNRFESNLTDFVTDDLPIDDALTDFRILR